MFSLPLALLAGTLHLPSLPIEPMSTDPNIANKGLAPLPLSSSPHVIFSFLTDRTVSEILRPFQTCIKVRVLPRTPFPQHSESEISIQLHLLYLVSAHSSVSPASHQYNLFLARFQSEQ